MKTPRLPNHIAHIDDETELGHGYIVTLANGCTFKDEPDCGVRSYDTLAELRADTKRANILKTAAQKLTAAE